VRYETWTAAHVSNFKENMDHRDKEQGLLFRGLWRNRIMRGSGMWTTPLSL